MAGGYQVGIASETKAFKQGIEAGIIDPLEDAQKELLELGRNRGPEQLERSLKDAEDASERLQAETKETARAIEREFKDAYRSVRRSAEDAGDGGAKGMGRLKDGAQEVTQEMGQNLGEAVSSIRGDLSDLGQVGQDTLGGLAATLAGTGPAGVAGAAALAAGAVGLGLVTAELQKQQEEAEKLRARLSDMYREAAEEGRSYLDTAQFISEATDVMFNPERADEWKRIREDAVELGMTEQELIKANSGDLAALAQVQERINGLIDDETRKREEAGAFWGGQNKNTAEQHLEGIAERWQKVGDAALEFRDKAQITANMTSQMWMDEIRNAGEAAEAVDEVGNRLYTLPDGKEVLIEAKTGRATDDISKFRGDLDGKIPKVKTTTVRATFDSSAATGGLNRWIAQNNGRTIRINSRLVAPMGGDL